MKIGEKIGALRRPATLIAGSKMLDGNKIIK
jgi:hypothetical protein